MVVRLVDETGGQFAGVVVVDQGDDGHLLAPRLARLIADQAIADQVANGLAAGGVTLAVDMPVKRLQKGVLQGNADARQIRHGSSRGWRKKQNTIAGAKRHYPSLCY